jgi:transcriptional regulator of acetoin/glycerol metabolism
VSRDGVVSAADLGLATAEPASAEEIGTLDHVERATIERALETAHGVISRAAAELGLSRQALYRRMERLGIVMRTVKA